MAANKIYVFDIYWSTRHIMMHVYDDINVAEVHESDQNTIHEATVMAIYIFKIEGII